MAWAPSRQRSLSGARAANADLRVPGESQTLPVDLGRLRELGRCTLATDLADVTIDFEPPGTAGFACWECSRGRLGSSSVSIRPSAAARRP